MEPICSLQEYEVLGGRKNDPFKIYVNAIRS